MHVVLQAPAVQAKPPEQVVAVGAGQVPLAQMDCAITLSVPEQLGAAPQFLTGKEHVPSALPAQVPPQVASVPQDVRFPCGVPEATGVQVPRKPVMSHAWQDPEHAVSQQMPSGAQVVPLAHPPTTVWQVWPFLLLHVPVASHVPRQRPVESSCPTTATQAWPDEQAWQGPGQSVAMVHAPPTSGIWIGTSAVVVTSEPTIEPSLLGVAA